MIIRDLTLDGSGTARILSASISWEDRDYPQQQLTFATREHNGEPCRLAADEPSADALLAACFPLAAVHGEARIRIEGRPCPMLIEGLLTAHAWWTDWGGMPTPAPRIEILSGSRAATETHPRRGVGFLSGGVDGLHMLMRNRQLYRESDPAFIREVLFIHGFDIGKRPRNPEHGRFEMALQRLEPIASELGVRIVLCRTNLRHLPSKPDFWEHRHNAAALAAVGHAAIGGSAFLFLGGTFPVSMSIPAGSHAAVDGLFSSQRITLIHEGSRFTRLDKVRDLATWPSALSALRVCAANLGDAANCGRCEKCLRTRLELLAAGIDESVAFGPSLTPPELWDEAVPTPIGHRALRYEELLEPLRARGFGQLCRMLERKIKAYRDHVGRKEGSCAGD